MGLHHVRLDGLHQVTLIGQYMLHQAPGGFVNVDIFLKGGETKEFFLFTILNNVGAETFMGQRGNILGNSFNSQSLSRPYP